MRRTYLFAAILFVAAMLLSTLPDGRGSVRAQKQTDGTPYFQYAVKFVCGRPTPGTVQVVAPGTYFTAINVHNPFEKTAPFRKKFAIALPHEKVGKISEFFQTKLGPDEAFEIDCADIIDHLHMLPQPTFVKGFAVIQSPTELDVVAVYTAAGGTGTVETIHMERVPARRIP